MRARSSGARARGFRKSARCSPSAASSARLRSASAKQGWIQPQRVASQSIACLAIRSNSVAGAPPATAVVAAALKPAPRVAVRGMGTTLTGVRSFGRDLMITHVGDSRAYLLRAGSLHRLTRDHTYAQLLIDTGQLAPSDPAVSRHRHVLTNALGGNTDAARARGGG